MLTGGLCKPARMGTMITSDSTYEWRNLGGTSTSKLSGPLPTALFPTTEHILTRILPCAGRCLFWGRDWSAGGGIER